MGRFNKPPNGVIRQSAVAARQPYTRYYAESEAYAGEELQGAGERPPRRPIIVRNRRYGGEGLTASLGEAPLNKKVIYIRDRRPEVEQVPQQQGMFNQTKDGPWRRNLRALAFALRPEYNQQAQRFPGAHTYYEAGSKQATGSPGNRILPSRRSRLTIRPEPRSYGSMTEKIA